MQGLGGGGLPVLGMAILGDLVPPRQLGRWLGYQGMLFAVAVVVGPLLGGLFVDHLSWRWAFFINVPFAIVAVAILVPRLHLPFRRIEHSIDYLGSALAHRRARRARGARDRRAARTSTGCRRSRARCWRCSCVVRRRRSCGGSGTPPSRSCPLRLFQNPVLRIAAPVNFTSGLLFYLGVFFLPVFFQEVAGRRRRPRRASCSSRS